MTKVARCVETILRRLTLAEKCRLLSGQDMWSTAAIPEKGIGPVMLTDGPHGVRTESSHPTRRSGPATYFPTGAGMAATWNVELLRRMGEALAEETKAYGCDVLLGPCVNLVRSPLAGRNFETLSEDPFLSGRLAAAYIQGLQSRGVGASLKHFACNNQETERMRGSSELDERTLREIYLPHFEYAVKEGRPWTVMCAYNRVNGVYASENRHLLTEILREEWGFDGLVVSDWGANHSVFASVAAGLDLEMPGPSALYRHLPQAVANWQIEEGQIDQAARRVLELVARAGKLGKGRSISRAKASANTPAHQKLARAVAEESITLLKNAGGILPLDPKRVRSVALIGLNAAGVPQGGGSSALTAPYLVSPLRAVRELLGPDAEVNYCFGCALSGKAPVPSIKVFTTPDGKQTGLLGEYFNGGVCKGKPVGSRIESTPDIWLVAEAATGAFPGLDFDTMAVRLSGFLQVETDGPYQIDLDVQGSARVWVDGKPAFETRPFEPDMGWQSGKAIVPLKAGTRHAFRLEYLHTPPGTPMHVRIGLGHGATGTAIPEAIALARRCDVAVVFAGFVDGMESECYDRKDMRLPGAQDELVSAVLDANPDAIVVLNTGAPVEMPWETKADTILQAYYPGMEGGSALVNILFGKVNPSGRLAVTYPRCLEDNPTHATFPGGRESRYDEGIFVGYRHYDTKKVAPLFSFGHGLSYTEFSYSELSVPHRVRAGQPVKVRLSVKNTGRRRGKEVVQLYVGDPEASVPRPEKELRGFAKVDLRPGETAKLEFVLDARAFAFYDVGRGDWKVEPGVFEILAGASSRDIRTRARVFIKA